MKPDDKLCYCFHVTQRKVTNWIRLHQPRVPSEISECGGAGTGCGWCVPFLRKLFDAAQIQQAQPLATAAIDLDAEQYAAQRASWVKLGKPAREDAGSAEVSTDK
jgi:NAD(P)H-nitrite reductase large subunit